MPDKQTGKVSRRDATAYLATTGMASANASCVVGFPLIASTVFLLCRSVSISDAGPMKGRPPMCQPSLWSSSINTQTTSRNASEPSNLTITSEIASAIACFCSVLKTPSTSLIFTKGMMCSFPDCGGCSPLPDANLENGGPLRYLRFSRIVPPVFNRDGHDSAVGLKKYAGKLLSLLTWHISSAIRMLWCMPGKANQSSMSITPFASAKDSYVQPAYRRCRANDQGPGAR